MATTKRIPARLLNVVRGLKGSARTLKARVKATDQVLARSELLTLGVWNLAPATEEREIDALWRGSRSVRRKAV
jgi:hypothetical protein